jgi:hypothetical protein
VSSLLECCFARDDRNRTIPERRVPNWVVSAEACASGLRDEQRCGARPALDGTIGLPSSENVRKARFKVAIATRLPMPSTKSLIG